MFGVCLGLAILALFAACILYFKYDDSEESQPEGDPKTSKKEYQCCPHPKGTGQD